MAGGFGGKAGGSSSTPDPSVSAVNNALARLYGQRSDLAGQLLSGNLPGAFGGFISDVLTPSVMNQATAAGFGRSGAALQAMSQALTAFIPGAAISLLSGLPGGTGGQVSESREREPGAMDYITAISGAAMSAYAKSCWLARAIFGGETTQVAFVRDWLLQHPWVRQVYRWSAPWLSTQPWAVWLMRPTFVQIAKRGMRDA